MMQMGCISWHALCSISCDMYPQHNSYCEAVTCTKLTLVTHTSLICVHRRRRVPPYPKVVPPKNHCKHKSIIFNNIVIYSGANYKRKTMCFLSVENHYPLFLKVVWFACYFQRAGLPSAPCFSQSSSLHTMGRQQAAPGPILSASFFFGPSDYSNRSRVVVDPVDRLTN